MKTHDDCAGNITIVVKGHLVTGCEYCLDDVVQSSPEAAKHKREWEKGQYRADLLQPTQRDFVKKYGANKAREHGWTEGAIRKWS